MKITVLADDSGKLDADDSAVVNPSRRTRILTAVDGNGNVSRLVVPVGEWERFLRAELAGLKKS